MKIKFDNVDFKSNSGPNNFGQKLAREIHGVEGLSLVNLGQDVQLSFIQMTEYFNPTVLRLDGIYFNTRQDWKTQNAHIKRSYESAKHIVVQSEFNLNLVQHYFGTHEAVSVIRNGTSLDLLGNIPPATLGSLEDKELWLCASSWRPHKRLKANIDYFLSFAPSDAILIVAGANPDYHIESDRIIYVGNRQWHELVSLMKRASTFIHLAWLDHCPNVVVDARASGCRIVCSSSGGTNEIAGHDSTVIEEDVWDFSPIDLYDPPELDFNRQAVKKLGFESNIDIKHSADCYISICRNLVKK